MIFNFPAVRFVETNSLAQQLEQVFAEIREIETALADGNKDAIAEELMDLTHALESFWRIVEVVHGKDCLRKLQRGVMLKNARRGYYPQLSVGESPAPPSASAAKGK